jgi:hypothetical protein
MPFVGGGSARRARVQVMVTELFCGLVRAAAAAARARFLSFAGADFLAPQSSLFLGVFGPEP